MIRELKVRHVLTAFLCVPLLLAGCTMTTAPSVATTGGTPTAEVVEEPTAGTPAGQGSQVEAGQVVTGTEEAGVATGCPEPTSDSQLVSSTAAGYCFLMPANFERSPYSDADGFHLSIYGPASTAGHRERGFVDVTESTTQTLDAIAQGVVDDVLAALPAFTPTQQSMTWGGVPAIQVTPLPGQDLNRKVLALANDHLYTLTFLPIDPSQTDAHAETEQLAALMADSFRFMTPTLAASSYAPLLSWEGEINDACTTLTIQSSGEAAVGLCGSEPSVTSTLAADNAEWVAVQKQFGDINADTPAGKIVFQGQGNADSDAWAHSLATWATFTAMEIQAGRTAAALRTALAWQLTDTPEHSGQCSQLVVLAYGYAYANLIPCEGSGESTPVAMGWLSDPELDTFMDWISNGARVDDKAGYLDAKGTTVVTPEQIGGWANGVYTRMLQ